MSPKVDSKASVATRSTWSRDVRPNTPGVTYVRRSYYYDREFSDSIIPPTGDFERFSPEGFTFRPRSGRQFQGARRGGGAAAAELHVLESDERWVDPFTKGRVLQSAGGGDDEYESVFELQDCGPTKPVQAPSIAQSQAETDTTLTDSESGFSIPGLDVHTFAQGVVVAMDLLVRATEAYQRIRDERNGEGSEEDGDGGFLGLDLDPYHLEAGPPRRILSSRKTTPRRSLVTAASTTTSVASSADRVQGHANSLNSDTAMAQAGQLLAPLPAIKRVCYYLIATVAFGVIASFGIALWWAHTQGDVSDGFTIGGYIIAVDALVVAVVSLVHRPTCRCWMG